MSDYDVQISKDALPLTTDNVSAYSAASDVTWGWHTDTINWNYAYPKTRHFYQITCPAKNCGAMNWCELNEIVECKKCKSRLKAVDKRAAYEIEVAK